MNDLITMTSFAGLPIEKPQERVATINCLIYGESSVGKTTLAGGCDAVPDMRKVLFIDIEKGDLSLRKTVYRPDVVRLSTWDELGKVYHALKAGGHGYRTLVVDSLTEVQDLSMKNIMSEESEEDDTPEWKHWNANQVRMLRLLRNFRDLPMNVIFTALSKEEKEKTGKVKKLPDLPGKLARKVPPIFDNVLYYYMKEVVEDGVVYQKRCLLTTKTEDTVAKNRGSDDLPQVIVVEDTGAVPTMQQVYAGIIGSASNGGI